MREPHAVTPLRQNRDFMALWTGHAISDLGSGIATIAYLLLALPATGSARTAGLIAFAGMAAGALVRLPAGVFVDRLPRKAVLVTCDVEARGHLAALGGPPLGSLLFGVAAALPIAVQAASFLTSGLLVGSIRQNLHDDERPKAKRNPVRRDLLTGIRMVWANAFLRVTLLCAAGFQLIFPAVILVVIASTHARGAPAVEIGAALSLAGVGGILGAWLSPLIQRRLPPPTLVFLFGATTTFALGALMFAYNPFLIGALLALTYFTSAPANGMLAAVQISITPPDMQGRVLSAVMLVAGLAAPLGPLAGGWLLQDFGVRVTFVVLTCMSAVITAAVLLSSAIRNMRLPAATDRDNDR